MNPAKRRRLDANASTLRKPFRSPLKVPTDDQASRRPSTANNLDQQKPNPSPSLASRPSHDLRATQSHTSCSLNKSVSTVEPSCSTNEITLLQKQYSALNQELRRLKQDLDVAEQAHKLCSSSQGKQLERVTVKWRDIARSAADQAFDITSTRVKEMGGIQAWQKSAQESSQNRDDRKPLPKDDRYDDDNDGEVDQRHKTAENTDNEDEYASEQQAQTFTMTTMLHQMNIDPNLLEFDETNEQWVD